MDIGLPLVVGYCPLPRPPKGSKKWNSPKYEPINTLGKLRDSEGVPFFGSFRGSGYVVPNEEPMPMNHMGTIEILIVAHMTLWVVV